MVPISQNDPEGWSAADKSTVVPESAGLNATEHRPAYCRERGLYPEQVEPLTAGIVVVWFYGQPPS